MRHFVRWWETLGRAERIVALSIGLSAPIAIINSTVWAIAVAYMAHEKSVVEIEQIRMQARATPLDGAHASAAPGEDRTGRLAAQPSAR
jgi:hypothetical protein